MVPGKNFGPKSAKLTGASQINRFPPYYIVYICTYVSNTWKNFCPKSGTSQINRFSRNYSIYVQYGIAFVFGNISWWVANSAMQLFILLIFSTGTMCLDHLSPNFTLIGIDDFNTNLHEFLVWISCCAFDFSRISLRDRVGEKKVTSGRISLMDYLVLFLLVEVD